MVGRRQVRVGSDVNSLEVERSKGRWSKVGRSPGREVEVSTSYQEARNLPNNAATMHDCSDRTYNQGGTRERYQRVALESVPVLASPGAEHLDCVTRIGSDSDPLSSTCFKSPDTDSLQRSVWPS